MSFSALFKNNLLVKWLRGDSSRYDLIVSMVGARLGERLVQLGGHDGALLAALGGPTGLTGQVVGVEESQAEAARVQKASEEAGVLADAVAAPGWETPLVRESFDLAIVPFADPSSPDFSARLGEAFRLLRPGGRCSVIHRPPKGRPPAAYNTTGGGAAPTDATTGPIVSQLQGRGFRAARLLAERDGLAFYEALKK